ncbi:MAG TPA: hypothetical protein VHG28_13265 [Longimicrobiaceae bacterium]|nr:hypothetical protein [Longimicrobiaceae bacterium]
MKEATGEYISERLPHLASRGLLHRIDVPEFGRERPTLLFRISEAGARKVAELEGHPYTPLPVPEADAEDRGNLFVPASAWSSLTALRRRAVDRIGPVRLGAHGWLTAVEVHQETRLRGEDLPWLLRRGLVERREVPAPSRRQLSLTCYRISDAGLRTGYVDAVPSPSGRVEFVEARVGEEPGPRTRQARATRERHGSRRTSRKAAKQ